MDRYTIIKPLAPKSKEWEFWPGKPFRTRFDTEVWHHPKSGLHVISAVEVMNDETPPKGPEYHVSISKNGTIRANGQEAKWVLRQFGLEGAEEDNHVPGGVVRNFWRPVNEGLVGLECECKESEPVIREDKGDFIWRPVPEGK